MNLVIIDYGLCNILSVYNGLHALGVDATITSDQALLQKADAAILPGVGAFEDGMKGLRAKGLIDPIHQFAKSGKPLLGICLGAQMMMERSHEFGDHEGLGLIPGEVNALKSILAPTARVPHIGWNALKSTGLSWDKTILEDVAENSEMYFVHSYFLNPSVTKHALVDVVYEGKKFCAVVGRDNIYGCQFHPEKSAAMGLKVLSNFVSIAKGSSCRQ